MMNVSMKEAKRMVKEIIESYLDKEDGAYILPQNKQRPIYLEGPAGIGKTEMVLQVAQEMNLGCVSYSLTHHTRQSAIGMPAIVDREQDNISYKATEYTMSEIVDSVYKDIRFGHKEGILFIDEINCVSETLSAVMLQFLQSKCFGPHKIPEGWIIVTAGNPGEYNKSAKRFDAVTLDRLRMIHIEPDADAWMDYATEKGIHPIVLSFIKNNPDCFYLHEHAKQSTQIVTPRGWEDLANGIGINEKKGYKTDEAFVGQFIQSERIIRNFMTHYRIYFELMNEMDVNHILNGTCDEKLEEEIKAFDMMKRFALVTILLSNLSAKAREVKKNWDERKKKFEDMEKDIYEWHSKVSNVLLFLNKISGDSPEYEYAVSMILKNQAMGYLLALVKNDDFFKAYKDINIHTDIKREIIREIEKME